MDEAYAPLRSPSCILEIPHRMEPGGQPAPPGPQYKRGRGWSFFKESRRSTQCQVPGCDRSLSSLRDYYKRYKICHHHLELDCMAVDGQNIRFCQQCGRFHLLGEFEGARRSCRKKLGQHNTRRKRRGTNPANRDANVWRLGTALKPLHSPAEQANGGGDGGDDGGSDSSLPSLDIDEIFDSIVGSTGQGDYESSIYGAFCHGASPQLPQSHGRGDSAWLPPLHPKYQPSLHAPPLEMTSAAAEGPLPPHNFLSRLNGGPPLPPPPPPPPQQQHYSAPLPVSLYPSLSPPSYYPSMPISGAPASPSLHVHRTPPYESVPLGPPTMGGWVPTPNYAEDSQWHQLFYQRPLSPPSLEPQRQQLEDSAAPLGAMLASLRQQLADSGVSVASADEAVAPYAHVPSKEWVERAGVTT